MGSRRAAILSASRINTLESPVVGDTYLLEDSFVGTGLLVDHDPDTTWPWDNWQAVGSIAGSEFTLDGAGGVANVFNPGSGTHVLGAIINVPSTEVNVEATVTSPASGAFVMGVIFRYISLSDYLYVRLNSTNNRLELVSSTGVETVLAFVAITLEVSTSYVLGVSCAGDVLTAYATGPGGTVSTTPYDAAGVNSLATLCGIMEIATTTSTHSTFTRFRARNSVSASALAGRLWYADGNDSLLTDWDSEANSGIADAGWTGYAYDLEIDTTLGTAGTRLQWVGDEDGQYPVKRDDNAPKNLPDEMYLNGYVYIPQLIERTGGFWLLAQFKQRNSEDAGIPTVSWNLGWDGSAMVTEINNNVASDGTYDGDAPDLSVVRYEVPVAQWFKFEFFIKWDTTTAGRIRFWLDNVEIYDFTGIRTMMSEPPEEWAYNFFPRFATVAHYSDELDPAHSTIYFKNVSISVGARLPDDYPVSDPT
jgi:hypothetical protein